MAARLNPRNQQCVREKIRATQLVNALTNHVLKRTKMAPSAVTAALGLLKKCVPDLQSVDVNARMSGETQTLVEVRFVSGAPKVEGDQPT